MNPENIRDDTNNTLATNSIPSDLKINPGTPASIVPPQPNLTPETPKTPEPTQKKKTPRKIVTIGLIIILIFVAILLTLLAFTYLERNRYGSATINKNNPIESNIVSMPISYADKSIKYSEFNLDTYFINLIYSEEKLGKVQDSVVIKSPATSTSLEVRSVILTFPKLPQARLGFNADLGQIGWDTNSQVFTQNYKLFSKDRKEFSVVEKKITEPAGKNYYLLEANNNLNVRFLLFTEVEDFSEVSTYSQDLKDIVESLSFDMQEFTRQSYLPICPDGWFRNTIRSLEEVWFDRCFLDLGNNRLEINDGIGFSIGFIPTPLLEKYLKDTKVVKDTIREFSLGSKAFSEKGFNGWYTDTIGKEANRFELIASKEVPNGYYEIHISAEGKGFTEYNPLEVTSNFLSLVDTAISNNQ